MKCPICSNTDTRVVDSRVNKDGAEIRRRRHCDGCSHRFTTYERAEVAFPMLIKKDGSREAWDKNKLMKGISKACEKRPVSIEKIDSLVDIIEEFLRSYGEREIPAEKIGEQVMAGLRKLDEVAYVRFASVYRSFKDIDEFMSELAVLVKKRDTVSKTNS